MTHIRTFDYRLPPELIAQHPAEPRESARLMVLSRNNHSIQHQTVAALPECFHSGDLVVLNNTKVFKARLRAKIQSSNPSLTTVELFLVKPEIHTSNTSTWLCLAKPARKLSPGSTLTIADDFAGTVVTKQGDGSILVTFPYSADVVIARANQYGSVPLPPYIKDTGAEIAYQTSYATVTGSVAAPTAGFHLTTAIRKQLQERGVRFTAITLHVGMGTFMPVKTKQVEDHIMHKEWVHIPDDAAQAIQQAKQEGRRVIAIGTTVVRTLEGMAALHNSQIVAFSGDVNLFIRPGFRFSVVDGLLTNFHLPKSTLLMLVAAFAGTAYIKTAYAAAVKHRYRFFSFGDCMFIV